MWLEGQEHELRSKKQMFSDLCCKSGVQLIVSLCCDDNSDDLFIHAIHECSRKLWCHAAEHFKSYC